MGISAGADVVLPAISIVLGFFSGFLYCIASSVLLRLQVDDPLNVFPIHGVCGFFGTLLIGLFDRRKGALYNGDDAGAYFGWQLLGCVVIGAWSTLLSSLFFAIANKLGVLRSAKVLEVVGLDWQGHRTVNELSMSDIRKGVACFLNTVLP